MHRGAPPSLTAKTSAEGRCLFLDKLDAVIDRLKELRLRAIRHASPVSVAAFAAEIPLPGEDCESETQLPDAGQGQLGWRPGCAAQELPYEACFADGDDTNKVTYTIQDTWFTSLDANDNEVCHEERFGDGGSRCDLERKLHEQGHVLLGAWRDAFPGSLEAYLDTLQGVNPGPRPPPLLPGPGTGADNELSSVAENAESPVSSAQLLRLQQELDDVCRCRQSFYNSIGDARRAAKCHRSRWHRQRSNGDLTSVMKSGGFGSPLVECIAADEPWPADEWDTIADARPRARLCGAASRYGDDAWGYASEEDSSASTSVHW